MQSPFPTPRARTANSPLAWIALCVGTASIFANMYSTQAILPLLGRVFDVGPATAGLTVSVVVLAVALGSLVAGPLSDRLGRKPVMVAASVALIIPTLATALAPTFGSLVLFRGLQGLLMPGLTSVAIAYVHEAFPARQRGAAMGVYVAGTVLGGLLSRGASSILADHLDWRAAMGFFTVSTALGALVLALFLPDGPEVRGAVRSLWSGLRLHLRNRRLLGLCLVGFTLFFSFIGTFTYLPFYLTGSPFRLPLASLGLVYLVWLLGVFSPVAGILAARLGGDRLLVCCLALALTGMSLTLFHSLPVVVLGLGLQALCQFTAIPCANLLVGEAASSARGSAASLYLCCYYLGGSVGALVPGILWQRAAWPGVIAICLAMGITALAGAVALGRAPRAVAGVQERAA